MIYMHPSVALHCKAVVISDVHLCVEINFVYYGTEDHKNGVKHLKNVNNEENKKSKIILIFIWSIFLRHLHWTTL